MQFSPQMAMGLFLFSLLPHIQLDGYLGTYLEILKYSLGENSTLWGQNYRDVFIPTNEKGF